jgi:hypothetical protein
MRPWVGRMKPATALSSVDLPQPDGPRMTKRSERSTLKLTRSVAVTRRAFVP